MTEETEKRMVTSLSLDMMEREKERKKEKKRRNDSTIVMLSKYIKRLIDINQSYSKSMYM